LVGGDSLEEQFSKLSTNPDIIISTPGRLRHLLVEVEQFTLRSIQFLVFDEGDRLFEMGFQDDIVEILSKVGRSIHSLIFLDFTFQTNFDFFGHSARDVGAIRSRWFKQSKGYPSQHGTSAPRYLGNGIFYCKARRKVCRPHVFVEGIHFPRQADHGLYSY
jgi:hypothetical protein